VISIQTQYIFLKF